MLNFLAGMAAMLTAEIILLLWLARLAANDIKKWRAKDANRKGPLD